MKEKVSKLYMYLGVLFISCLCFSNVAAFKMLKIGPWAVTAGVLIFPITYIISDVIAEVYGFKKARALMWLGFAMNLLMVGYFQVAIWWKGPEWFEYSGQFATVLGNTPRIFGASLIAYIAGNYLNAMVLSKMKVKTAGKGFGVRAIVSTIIGEGVDAMLFITLAFIGTMPFSELWKMVILQLTLKVLYEVIILPITTIVVKKIKEVEGVDTYDHGIKYGLIK